MSPTRTSLLIAASLLIPAGAGVADAQRAVQRVTIVRERTVIRIPLRSMDAVPVPRPLREWKESRGPKCIDRTDIAGASLYGPNGIDIILRDNSRLRAELENSCPAIDYYAGFYLKPTSDGKICQDRDAIHARSGGECQIDRFRKLTPKTPRIKARPSR